jgi:hypothetical protein
MGVTSDQIHGFVCQAETDVWAEGMVEERLGDRAVLRRPLQNQHGKWCKSFMPVVLQADLTALGLPDDIAEILANEGIDYPLLAECVTAVGFDLMFRDPLFMCLVAQSCVRTGRIKQGHHIPLSWHVHLPEDLHIVGECCGRHVVSLGGH